MKAYEFIMVNDTVFISHTILDCFDCFLKHKKSFYTEATVSITKNIGGSY